VCRWRLRAGLLSATLVTALATSFEIRLRQLICDFRTHIDHLYCKVKDIMSVVHQAFDQSGVLLRTKFTESVVETAHNLMGIPLKLIQRYFEVAGIEASLFLETALHLPGGDNAGGHFLIE
jgi:hypothetical protein